MNKFLISILLFFTCITTNARPVSQQFSIPSPSEYQSTWPELTVLAHTFPPFQFKKNGEMVGPMMTIMNKICFDSMIRCNITMEAFRNQYKKILNGEGDVIFSFRSADDEERIRLFEVSSPIIDTSYSFFVSSTSNWVWTGNINDLNNRTVGVYGPSGSSILANAVVSKNPTAKLVIEPTNLVVFQQLIVGKYGEKAAIIANKDVGLAYLKEANIFGPKVAGDISKVQYGFGFLKSSPHFHLFQKMNETLIRLKHEGYVRKILTENESPLEASK